MGYFTWVPLKPKGEIVFGELIAMDWDPSVPERPTPPGNGNGLPPVIPPPEIPESAVAVLFAPPAGATPPADPPLAAGYEWLIAVYGDKSSSWAQVGPHMTPSK